MYQRSSSAVSLSVVNCFVGFIVDGEYNIFFGVLWLVHRWRAELQYQLLYSYLQYVIGLDSLLSVGLLSLESCCWFECLSDLLAILLEEWFYTYCVKIYGNLVGYVIQWVIFLFCLRLLCHRWSLNDAVRGCVIRLYVHLG